MIREIRDNITWLIGTEKDAVVKYLREERWK